MPEKDKLSKGSYILFLRLDEKGKIDIGRLGSFHFKSGLYLYVGSGMNNLDKRVERHLSNNKKKHWHIDYFLEEGEVVGTVKFRTKQDIECKLNGIVSEICEETPVEGFGSSDCSCEAHFHFY
ncbi:MAG: GIY-YIG nuclease family protein [Candidatus Aenigmatarchaeota archaeon]